MPTLALDFILFCRAPNYFAIVLQIQASFISEGQAHLVEFLVWDAGVRRPKRLDMLVVHHQVAIILQDDSGGVFPICSSGPNGRPLVDDKVTILLCEGKVDQRQSIFTKFKAKCCSWYSMFV